MFANNAATEAGRPVGLQTREGELGDDAGVAHAEGVCGDQVEMFVRGKMLRMSVDVVRMLCRCL